MSEYRDFDLCVLCRSKKILDEYNGDYEITLLLNALSYAVAFTSERLKELKKDKEDITAAEAAKWRIDKINGKLKKYCPTSKEGKLNHLRNAICHFHIMVKPPYKYGEHEVKKDKDIEKIVFWNQDAEKSNCIANAKQMFVFTTQELRDFSNELLNESIDIRREQLDSICENCKYNTEFTHVNPDR